MSQIPYISYDMYESSQEIVIIMPIGGVKKESLQLKIEDYRLSITGERAYSPLKENLVAIKEECYRGPIQQTIDLPAQVYFDQIHSKLTAENILQIIVPKAHIPEQITITVEE